MKLISKEIWEDWHDAVVHTISKKKYEQHINNLEGEYIVWLNDYSMMMRCEKLPHHPYIANLLQQAIEVGAEVIIIKKGKK